jgi:hypothetical protein
MKTRTVQFSYGTVKNANLKVPAEAYSIVDAVKLIRESFLEYMFSRPCLMSDEVLVSSIGHSNFFEGALGGYESRVNPEFFKAMKGYALSAAGQALAVAEYREPKASRKQHYIRASKCEAVPENERKFLALVAESLPA